MRTLLLTIIFFAATYSFAQEGKNLYSFIVEDITGEKIDLSKFEGKKVLIVNTASKCGLTPQYSDLEKLFKKYKDNNFVILGFPANNFLKQEPGSNSDIAEFCQKNYGVSFPIMSKISVKGDDIHPLYKWLTSLTNSEVEWNFQKYMIDEKGNVQGFAKPRTLPFDKQIIDWIEGKK